jgi:hypothetical protein
MHPCAKSCLIAIVLTASLFLSGQERYQFSDPNLLARLSFDNSGSLQSAATRHICLAVSKDGSYRMVRRLADLYALDRLEGVMSHEQLQEFQKLVGSSDLRSLPENYGSLIRQSAESFAAEIATSDQLVNNGTLRVKWLNADG